MQSEKNFLLKSVRESAGIRLAVLFGSFFIFLLLTSVLSASLNYIHWESDRTRILLTSAIQCILAFCLPAFMVAKFSSNRWSEWLKLNRVPSIKAMIGVVVVYIISLPAMEWLIEWNNSIHFPEQLASLESTLREWEESAQQTTDTILQSNGLLSMLVGVIVIGCLTGFSEELFFRGGLQGIFLRTNISKGAAVWMAAILFSVMHFQFFGFVPRLLMGVFFGYLLIWSRSIWLPVFAHTLNNSMVVIMAYATGNSSSSILDNASETPLTTGFLPVIISLVLTILFFIFFRQVFTPSKWLRKQLPPVSGI